MGNRIKKIKTVKHSNSYHSELEKESSISEFNFQGIETSKIIFNSDDIMTEMFLYNEKGEITHQYCYSLDNPQIIIDCFEYRYDRENKLIEELHYEDPPQGMMLSPTSSSKFFYNEEKQLVSEKYTNIDDEDYEIHYKYDKLGNLKEKTKIYTSNNFYIIKFFSQIDNIRKRKTVIEKTYDNDELSRIETKIYDIYNNIIERAVVHEPRDDSADSEDKSDLVWPWKVNIFRISNIYNEDNLLLESGVEYKGSKGIRQTKYSYDLYKNEICQEEFINGVHQDSYLTTYKYDKFNNWLIKTVNRYNLNNPKPEWLYTEEREIEYF